MTNLIGKYNSGTARTTLHYLKNKLEILSEPGFILILSWSSSYKISVKVHELKLIKDKTLASGVCNSVCNFVTTCKFNII